MCRSSAMLAAEKSPATKEIPAEVKTMLNRLEEIKEMDKSSLKSSEKKELVKKYEIKSELKRSDKVFIFVGAIIIIILLLILLL
jgi:hypothetical protein